MGRTRRGDGGSRPDAETAGAPQGPRGPRRPAAPVASKVVPGRGKNRPAPSLVNRTEESTPSLRYRWDDVGRGFLYRPVLGLGRTPEPTYGPRSTDRLTRQAARKVKGAALKAAQLGLDLRTFMTFTCAPEDREAVANGQIALGREMKRTLNAVQQRFRREGYEDFCYIWVAENPHNENPHVHLLTNHRVPRSEFRAFAAWLESLWSHGFVKVERIRKPERAGVYILKAVGYSVKGSQGAQGTVRGNRYGISRNIRIDETTGDLFDEDAAADRLLDLIRTMPEGSGCEPLGRLWLTPYGLSFPAGTDMSEVGKVLDILAGRRASG